MAVAAEAEQDGRAGAVALGFEGLFDGAFHSMVRFRGGHDAFGLCEQNTSFETGVLGIGLSFYQAEFFEVRHQRCHAVVAKTTGVEAWAA